MACLTGDGETATALFCAFCFCRTGFVKKERNTSGNSGLEQKNL